MLVRWLHKPLTCLLLLGVVQVPLPWVHRHDDMDGPRLGSHLKHRHPCVGEMELPSGWHVHLYWPGLLAEGGILDGWHAPTHLAGHRLSQDAVALGMDADSTWYGRRILERSGRSAESVGTANVQVASGSTGRFSACALVARTLRGGDDRYKRLSVFLL